MKTKVVLVPVCVALLLTSVVFGALLPHPQRAAFAATTLEDVSGHWAEKMILRMVQLGVVSGYEDGTFRPDSCLTRAHFVKMLVAATGLEPVTAPVSTFPDTVAHWVHTQGYLEAAVGAYIIVPADYPRGLFEPERYITRQEMAMMVVRTLDLDTEARLLTGTILGFSDGPVIPARARGYVALAVARGVVTGYDNRFSPNDPATRAQAVTMIGRMLESAGKDGESGESAGLTVGDATDGSSFAAIYEEYPRPDTALEVTAGGYVLLGPIQERDAETNSEVDAGAWLLRVDGQGQEVWTRNYGGEPGDSLWDLARTPDGGYVLAGRTQGHGAAFCDGWLVKVDSDGRELWSRTYGGPGYDGIIAAHVTAGGKFLLVGSTRSSPEDNNLDGWVALADIAGNQLWRNTYGGEGRDAAIDACETADGNLAIVGYLAQSEEGRAPWLIKLDPSGRELYSRILRAPDPFAEASEVMATADGGLVILGRTCGDWWLLKVDREGREVWSHTFRCGYLLLADSATATSDGGFVVTGSKCWDDTAGRGGIWVAKVNDKGEELWARTLGELEHDCPLSVTETADGGLLIAACHVGEEAFLGTILMKLDAEGRLAGAPGEPAIAMGSFFAQSFGEDDAIATSLRPTSDGGYVVAGYNEYPFGASGSSFLRRVDREGKEVWSRALGSGGRERASCLAEVDDGGYLVAGTSKPSVSAGLDGWLVKTDGNGNRIWEKTYGGDDAQGFYYVESLAGGGCVAAGYTESAGESDTWVVRLDAKGKELWQRNLGAPGSDLANSVHKTGDGGFIVGGEVSPEGGEVADARMIRLDAQGNLVWSRTYGGPADDGFFDVLPTSDGGFIATGYTASSGLGGNDLWLVKMDRSGTEVWSRTFGWKADDVGLHVIETADGGYVASGYADNYRMVSGAFLLKVSASGEEIWSRAYARGWAPTQLGLRDVAFWVEEIPGGYLLACGSQRPCAGTNGANVIKTDSWGRVLTPWE